MMKQVLFFVFGLCFWSLGLVGQGSFWEEQVIGSSANGAWSVYAADIDSDGDMDVLSASFQDDKIAWYENDGIGGFGSQQVISTSADKAQSVYAVDIDGDGDMDILSASRDDDKIAWYENDGLGGFGSQQIISTSADKAQSVYAADIDGDGDMDVLSASYGDDKVAWYENDGLGGFSLQQVISTAADGAYSVYAADIDGDGDMDVLSASFSDDKIAWYENDGIGGFGPQQVISTSVDGAYSVYTADIDGDGDMDVLSASPLDSKIAWYTNDGLGGFGLQQVISTSADNARSVYTADIDGDGDMDVLSASYGDSKIAWYENDGLGRFSPQQVISTSANGAHSVYAADIDGDGDMDALSASWLDDKIAWYLNIVDNPKISGYVFYDTNQNSIFDNGDFGVDFVPLEFTVDGGEIVDNFSNTNGFYLYALDETTSGEYTINFNPPTDWTLTTPNSYTHTLAAGESATNNNFGIYPSTLITDISPYLTSGIPRCNWDVTHTLTYINEGTTIGTQGIITFQPDAATTYISATPEPDSTDVAGNIYWHFNNLLPYQQQQIQIVLQMPSVDFVGAELSMNSIVETFDEEGNQVDISSFGYRPIVLCAYDPNDKLVTPAGVGVDHQTLLDEELIYTIRFQNTGNDTAFNIIIADTLSQHLDWESFRPITSSHAMQAYRMESGKVEFHFNNILLVDSVANEPESHGFVMYAIQPQADITDGTLIENTAYIFFDFNPPIVTNTTQNLMVEAIDMPVRLEVLLEGAYNAATGLMNTALSVDDLLPLQQPYGGSPWNYMGTEEVLPPNAIADDICDWVLVEIRDRVDKDIVVAAKAAFVRNDGLLMDINGSEGVLFNTNSLNYGESYYIVIRHRNHLDVISSALVTLPNDESFKMTLPVNVEGGVGQLADLGDGNYGMLAGDYNGDGVITVDDLNLFLTQASMLNSYIVGDGTLDGDALVQDFNVYLPNISVIGVQEIRY